MLGTLFSVIRMSFLEPIFLKDVVGVALGDFTLTSFLLPNFLKAAEFLRGVKMFVFALTAEEEEGWFSFSLGESFCWSSTARLFRTGFEGGAAAACWTLALALATLARIDASYSACLAASNFNPGCLMLA